MSYTELRAQLHLRPTMPVEPLVAEDVDEARALGRALDPFDRLIAATAIRLGFPLVTRDAALTAVPGLQTLW